jgi:hypothetical protein
LDPKKYGNPTQILNTGMETNRRMIPEAHSEDNCSVHSNVLNISTQTGSQPCEPLDPHHKNV